MLQVSLDVGFCELVSDAGVAAVAAAAPQLLELRVPTDVGGQAIASPCAPCSKKLGTLSYTSHTRGTGGAIHTVVLKRRRRPRPGARLQAADGRGASRGRAPPAAAAAAGHHHARGGHRLRAAAGRAERGRCDRRHSSASPHSINEKLTGWPRLCKLAQDFD